MIKRIRCVVCVTDNLDVASEIHKASVCAAETRTVDDFPNDQHGVRLGKTSSVQMGAVIIERWCASMLQIPPRLEGTNQSLCVTDY